MSEHEAVANHNPVDFQIPEKTQLNVEGNPVGVSENELVGQLGPDYIPEISPPMESRGYIDWKKLAESPELLKSYIQQRGSALIGEGVSLTHDGLNMTGYSGLGTAISKYYPESFAGLRRDLQDNRTKERKPVGYWDDPKNIEDEARLLVGEVEVFNATNLRNIKRDDLLLAISKKYPGGMHALRENLGTDFVGRKPAGFWADESNVENEIRGYIEKHGHFPTSSELKKNGGLSSAITNRGVAFWREKFNQPSRQRTSGYWQDSGVIESEARAAMEKGIDIKRGALTREGYSALAAAIKREYPGNYGGLRKKLGLTVRKPNGYWSDTSNIENEARAALERGVKLTSGNLAKAGLGSLAHFIRNGYPGGFEALKEKLNISPDELKVSPDQADEMMRAFEVE